MGGVHAPTWNGLYLAYVLMMATSKVVEKEELCLYGNLKVVGFAEKSNNYIHSSVSEKLEHVWSKIEEW